MKRFNDDPETSMPAHAPDRAPVSDPAAGSFADPVDPGTLLDAAPPR